MDLSILEKLGKIGGVPAIAIGAVTVMVDVGIGKIDQVPDSWRAPLLLAVTVVGMGSAVWVGRRRGGDQVARTQGDDSSARNENPSKDGARQIAETKGKNSPAVNIRR